MSYIGRQPQIGNFQICDAISVVNGQAAYTMQVGSVNVSPESALTMIVSLNGVIQKPNSSFTVSGSTITFSSNLATGDVIDFIQIFGNVLDLGVPSDSTVSTAKIVDANITTAKIADDAVTTDKLANSINSAITANTAKVTNATHSGEVTGATALTIADNIVDEANLKVSNSPTNGYFLSAQSGNTGGLTWAEAGGGVSDGFQAITSGSGTSNASGTLVVNDELFDDGSNYNTSNGRYTAPSNGFYLFHAGALQSGSAGTYFYFTKNGSAVGSQSRWGYNGGGNQIHMSMNMLIDLSSGDYINIYSSAAVYINQYLTFGGCKLY